jgi:hypothetical protein
VKSGLGCGQAKGEKAIHFFDKAKVVTVDVGEGKLVDMLTVEAKMVQKEQPTKHAIPFHTV